MDKVAYIEKIFCSIQGEGIYAGTKQVFARFCCCNLHCALCDTKRTWRKRENCLIANGKRVKNPIDREIFLSAIKQFQTKWVSLTGGEPLLWSSFLEEVLPQLKRDGFLVYLETNGTLPEQLLCILKYIDVVAMDFKLKSFCGFLPPKEKQEEFLNLLKDAKNCFIKCVVTKSTSCEEIEEAARTVASIHGQCPIVIQPAYRERILPKVLFSFHEAASKYLEHVYIIPQIHRLLGVE